MTKIVVDAMGSDNYPTPDVEGAVMAAREYGVEIILVGDASKIQPMLDSVGAGESTHPHCQRARNADDERQGRRPCDESAPQGSTELDGCWA